MNQTDPDETMSWFIAQLLDAERSRDKVWVIGHIANGDTMSDWSKLYYQVVNR